MRAGRLALIALASGACDSPEASDELLIELRQTLAAVQTDLADAELRIATLEADNASLALRLEAVEADALRQEDIADVEAISMLSTYVQVDAEAHSVAFVGANVSVLSGSGETGDDNSLRGLGNLIVGYNEPGSVVARTGSHNLVVGPGHSYTGYGGLVAGQDNVVSGNGAAVLGGTHNTASGRQAAVLGGHFNTASGNYSTVSAGLSNVADGEASSVSGGRHGTARGAVVSVSGGTSNLAEGDYSSISGGAYNKAGGEESHVSGGVYNEAAGDRSSIAGGDDHITADVAEHAP